MALRRKSGRNDQTATRQVWNSQASKEGTRVKSMKRCFLVVTLTCAVAMVYWSPSQKASMASSQAEMQRAFFENLKRLCGQRFEGETVLPLDKDHPLAGKKLIMSVERCGEKEIRIPFLVGEDKSRTWIVTVTDAGLLFKHDHRHADGTPDKITMYGGLAAPNGTQYVQSFPADADTAKLIPEAATNVWTLQITPEKQKFTYYLERHGQPRYKASFDLKALPK